MSEPRIILHNAVSADGRMDWFEANLETYYELAGRFDEETSPWPAAGRCSKAAEASARPRPEEIPEPAEIDPADARPILAVPDGRDRIKNWTSLRTLPFWRDVLALILDGAAGPDRAVQAPGHSLFPGRADPGRSRATLAAITGRYNAKTIRVDSGGTLNGVLLRRGLVDEISLLVHPRLVGGISPRTIFRADDLTSAEDVIRLELTANETLSGGLVWLRYNVITKRPPAFRKIDRPPVS